MYRRLYLTAIAFLAATLVGLPLTFRAVQAVQLSGRSAPSAIGQWSGFFQLADGSIGVVHAGFAASSPISLKGFLGLETSGLFNAYNFQLTAFDSQAGVLQVIGRDLNNKSLLLTNTAYDTLDDGGGVARGALELQVPGLRATTVKGVHVLLRDFLVPPGQVVPSVDGSWSGNYGGDTREPLGSLVLELIHQADGDNPLPPGFKGTMIVYSGDDVAPALEFFLRGSISTTGRFVAIGQGAYGQVSLDGQAIVEGGIARSVTGTHQIDFLSGEQSFGWFSIEHPGGD